MKKLNLLGLTIGVGALLLSASASSAAVASTTVSGSLVPVPAVCNAGTCSNGKLGICTVDADCYLPTSTKGVIGKISMNGKGDVKVKVKGLVDGGGLPLNAVTVSIRVCGELYGVPMWVQIDIECFNGAGSTKFNMAQALTDNGGGSGAPFRIGQAELFGQPLAPGCESPHVDVGSEHPACVTGGKIAGLGILQK